MNFTSSKPKHIGLFEGIGGFSLAAKVAGFDTVAWCEWSAFCQRALRYWFPEAEAFGDITKSDFSKYANTIDLVSGGFPCQGFSLAGNRLGTEDARYLWPEMLNTIKIVKPTWIIGENVTGILSMEDKSGVQREVFPQMEGRKIVRFDTVDLYEAIYTRQAKMLVNRICEDLEAEEYEVQTFAIPAASVGAPHRRERIWFVAYSHNAGTSARYRSIQEENEEVQKWRNNAKLSNPDGLQPSVDTNAKFARNTNSIRKMPFREFQGKKQGAESCGDSEGFGFAPDPTDPRLESLQREGANGIHGFENAPNPNGRRQPSQEHRQTQSGLATETSLLGDWSNFPTQSPICGRDDGFSERLVDITFSNWRNESIKSFGNAVVPHIPYAFMKEIQKYL